ncbi:hypothetical protein [Pseudalkalibacillus hwajinpoensis]|uniref:hypothetical protein n=1 Tax=Guptibacillus hwajinpoensis TaxID=208199 RepID=UPI00384E58A2
MIKKENFKSISLTCLIVSVLVWVPNVVFQVSSLLWILTFFIAPLGIVFAALIKKNWLIIMNTMMFFSFFILMFLGYFANYITDGKP